MSKILKKVKAGRLVFAVVYTPCSPGDSPKVRAEKRKASTAAREKLNAKTSFQKLERSLAANFDTGDLFVTPTYDDKHLPDSRDKAMRKVRFFLSKLKKSRAARGEELHYIYVTEGAYPGGRLHHHLVINSTSTGNDLEEICKCWIYGDNVEVRQLSFDKTHTYEDLASYLTKEPREWGHPKVGERTWTPSLGLLRPETETEAVPDCVTLTAPPEAETLARVGPVTNGYGEFTWIKYMMPKADKKKRPKIRRRRQKKE